MSLSRVTEITAESTESFEDAIRVGIQRACQSLAQVQGAWIKEQKIVIQDGKVIGFRVDMKVSFSEA